MLEKTADSELLPVEIPGVPRAYIVRNPLLEQLLLNRNLYGLAFAELCAQISERFLAHFRDELSERDGELAELMLLSKGYVYLLQRAAARSLEINLPINFAATARVAVRGSAARVEVPYVNFDTPARTLIIGDTVASGATVCAALERYLDAYDLKRVYVFSMAGTAIGARAVAEFCEAHGVEVVFAFGLAAFGLGRNGFDLSFLHPETICDPAYRDRANDRFHGRPISAVGWDFGSQSLAVAKYRALCWIEAEYWGLRETDVFVLARRPTDRRMIHREYPAYSDRLPDIEALVE